MWYRFRRRDTGTDGPEEGERKSRSKIAKWFSQFLVFGIHLKIMEYSIISSILGCRRATLSKGSKRWILITWVVPQAVVPFHFVLISFCVSVSRNANMKNTCQRFSVLPVHASYIVPAHVYGEKNQRFVFPLIFSRVSSWASLKKSRK